NKKSDMDLAAKGLGAKEWNNSLKTKLSLLPKKLFRIRMSRNFGMKMLTMTNLSTECLIQLTKLGYDATPFNQRSEERRVGKECRSRWWPHQSKKKREGEQNDWTRTPTA